jgi:hypothetical protein
MAGSQGTYLDPTTPSADQPCSGCGQSYQYRPSIDWVMHGPCDQCAEGIPGIGQWGWLDDGRPIWRLNDEDPWQTLTLPQVTIKDAEERAAIQAIRRRRSLN